jgi:hypothetical protein
MGVSLIVRLSVRLLLSPGSEDLKEQEMSRHQAESSFGCSLVNVHGGRNNTLEERRNGV